MKKEVQIYIREILAGLKALLPEGNHNFQLGEDGRLWLWVHINDVFQSIIFDENYEDIQPDMLVVAIIDELKKAGYKIWGNDSQNVSKPANP